MEFDENKILAHFFPADLMIIKDWEVVSYIDCSINPGNTDKFCLTLLPGFDPDKFPFIASSGHDSLNLINVKDETE